MKNIVILSEAAGPVPLINNFRWMDPETERTITAEQAAKHPDLYAEALKVAEEMRRDPLNIPTY